MSDVSDALAALIEHPGWTIFAEHAAAEWGPGACWKKVKAAGGDMEKVDYTNQHVGLLVNWPADEVARIKRTEAVTELRKERGGYR